MSVNKLISSLPFLSSRASFLVLLLGLSLSLTAQEQNVSTVIYESSYFAQYNAVSLTDMIRNIPGGETILRRGGGQRGNLSLIHI